MYHDQKSCQKKQTRYVGYLLLYSSNPSLWAVHKASSLFKAVAPNPARVVFSARRGRNRVRAFLRAEAFPAMPKPRVLLCALTWVPQAPSLSSARDPCIHCTPARKLPALRLWEMRQRVGCLSVMVFFCVNLRGLTFIPSEGWGAGVGLHKKPQSPPSAGARDLLPGNCTFCNEGW